MPHISRKKLSEEDFRKIYKSFLHSFSKFRAEDSIDKFFWEFLTSTEKVMFSKRLAIILLLEKGASHYAIWNALQVSPSTVERLAKRLDRGGYADIVKLLKENESNLVKIIGALFEILTPSPYHVSRKKFLEAKRKGR